VSTVLVILGVVAAAICVLRIALSDPDQPATIGRPTDRAAPRRHPARAQERAPSPAEIAAPVRPARPPVRAAARSLSVALWVRARSAMALVILVTFTGVVLAVLLGTGLALAFRAFTRAVQ
jgi:hypothetical protein